MLGTLSWMKALRMFPPSSDTEAMQARAIRLRISPYSDKALPGCALSVMRDVSSVHMRFIGLAAKLMKGSFINCYKHHKKTDGGLFTFFRARLKLNCMPVRVKARIFNRIHDQFSQTGEMGTHHGIDINDGGGTLETAKQKIPRTFYKTDSGKSVIVAGRTGIEPVSHP